jgi:hypothetical protein
MQNLFGGFCYNPASNSPTVAIRAMVGLTIGILQPSQGNMQRNFARYATVGRFYYDWASYLLAYRAVTPAICQRSPQPLRELPTLANGLDAES